MAAHDAGRRHPVAATGARTGRGAQGEQARGTGAVRGRTLTVEHRPVRRRSYTLLVDLALLKSQHIRQNCKQQCPQKILPSTMSNAHGKETSTNILVWLDFSCQTHVLKFVYIFKVVPIIFHLITSLLVKQAFSPEDQAKCVSLNLLPQDLMSKVRRLLELSRLTNRL